MNHPKFLFDRSFDDDASGDPGADTKADAPDQVQEPEEPEVADPTFSEEDVERARLSGFSSGKEEALRESANAIENQLIDSSQAIASQLAQLIRDQQLANSDTYRDSINIARAITRKCFPALNMDDAFPEIERIIRLVLPQILEEPRVIIHVHPDLSSLLSERIEQFATDANFEGRFLISADADVPAGDCRIDWSNGRIERKLDEILSGIDTVIDQSLANMGEAYVPAPDALQDDPLDRNGHPGPLASGETADTVPDSDVGSDDMAENSAPEEPDLAIETAPTEAPTRADNEATSAPEAGQMEINAQESATESQLTDSESDAGHSTPQAQVGTDEAEPTENGA